MTIDPKDLLPLELKDWQPGGVFYRKESETEYSLCIAPTEEEMELASPWWRCEYRELTKKFHAEGRLFTGRRPWSRIEKK